MSGEQDSTRVDRLKETLGSSKELLIGLVCLVLGSASVAVNLSEGDIGGLALGIALLVFALFWLNGGLMGHGSL